MNNRERFFNLLERKSVDRTPFFPDISTWYEYTRKEFGTEELFGPGVYIPDGIEFNKRESRLTGRMAKMTFLDFYREYDWGLPVHMYEWYKTEYGGGVEEITDRDGRFKTITYNTSMGSLKRTYILDQDGSWAPYDHLIKDIKELDILKYILEHTKYIPLHDRIEKFHEETQGFGVCDLVIRRSPFGKLVHELLGFEEVVYALMDNEQEIVDFLEFQEYHDLRLIELAAQSPARLVIISDHADENLISPKYYKQYCIPYYNKACSILHKNNKFVSTHLDGNIKGFLPILKDTGFDLLDGCTPAPMFNYEVEELAAAIKGSLHCYLGVPSTLFTMDVDTQSLVDFGVRISRAFDKRVLVNVGDILPVIGNIEQVIEVGKAVMSL